MPLNGRLGLIPAGAQRVSDSLAILRDDEYIVFFNAAGPIFRCDLKDRLALRVAAVTIVEQGLAGTAALAAALGVHRTTIFRDVRKFRESGVAGLIEKRRGPKGPHALTPEIQKQVKELLNQGESIRSTAKQVGVSNRGIRHGIERGLIPAPGTSCEVVEPEENAAPTDPRVRAAVDQSCDAGVAVKRTDDRALACVGMLAEALPEFQPSESVQGAGVLLALPSLIQAGLIEVGEEVYGQLRNGYFGLKSVLLTFAFMALLRIKTPEQLTEHAPGELGLLLGLDRAPEVKTLRRKLRELGERELAQTLAQRFAEYWAKNESPELAILYVDGHVRPYHGRKHKLPKLHVQQRGRPMPGTKDFHVNDRRADPLLWVTAEATEGLLSTLESTLLPQVRDLVGPDRRVTITFDREGWSPDLFAKWKTEKFDILTYRKGKQTQWQRRFFELVEGTVGGQKVSYHLAERSVKLSNGLRVREIRRLTDDAHQTAVITTNETMSTLEVAHRMFSRWRQENFFRYMRHEFALDHLCTYDTDAADPNRIVTNPERAQLQKKLKTARASLATLIQHHTKLVPGKTIRVGGKSLNEEALDQLIMKREAEIKKLAAAIDALPTKLPLEAVLDPREIVQLERERKILVDTIKLAAYRAESSLARLVEPIFARHEDEARKFLKSIFQATADIIPDDREGSITVRFHGLASPRATRALGALCDLVTQREALYPGTPLRLRFEVPTLQELSP